MKRRTNQDFPPYGRRRAVLTRPPFHAFVPLWPTMVKTAIDLGFLNIATRKTCTYRLIILSIITRLGYMSASSYPQIYRRRHIIFFYYGCDILLKIEVSISPVLSHLVSLCTLPIVIKRKCLF